jgi:hypothetical protein
MVKAFSFMKISSPPSVWGLTLYSRTILSLPFPPQSRHSVLREIRRTAQSTQWVRYWPTQTRGSFLEQGAYSFPTLDVVGLWKFHCHFQSGRRRRFSPQVCIFPLSTLPNYLFPFPSPGGCPSVTLMMLWQVLAYPGVICSGKNFGWIKYPCGNSSWIVFIFDHFVLTS